MAHSTARVTEPKLAINPSPIVFTTCAIVSRPTTSAVRYVALFGRPIAFATFTFLARHAAWTLKEPANENSFIKLARRGEIKHDDLLEKVTVSSLRAHIAAARLTIVREELHATATVRRLPAFVANALKADITRDIFISNMEYVLAHEGSGA